jgi:hypothetical protein
LCSHLYGALHEFEDIAETRDGKDGTHIVVDAFDIDVAALFLRRLQNAEEYAQTC